MIARIATRSFGAWTSPLRGSRTILTKVVVCISVPQFDLITLTKRVKARRASVKSRFQRKHISCHAFLVAPGEEKDEDLYGVRCEERIGARSRLRLVVASGCEKSSSRG